MALRGGSRAVRAARAVVVGLALAAVTTALGGCAAGTPQGTAGPTPEADAVHVVTTMTILADLVREIGGTRVRVTSLVPKGGDVHTFDPKPSSMRAVVDAQLVVRNGLGLDDWLAGLIANTGAGAPVVAASEDLPGVTYLHASDGTVNPHVWMNPRYAYLMAVKIEAALAGIDPGHADRYAAGLAGLNAQLTALDTAAHTALGGISAANRTVISFHDAFPYFAAAYGLLIDGSIVAAPGQDPSAGTVAALEAKIRSDGIRAIFAEAQFNDELAQMIARETGAVVVTSLYTDSVGDAPADTYVRMMQWNVQRVAQVLTRP